MAEWNTRFTDLVGCRYPIIQGAYGGFGRATIAGPVSKAGGLGIITAGACGTPDVLREDIEQVRAMTDEPFGVNISVGLCKDPIGMLDVIIETKVPLKRSIRWATANFAWLATGSARLISSSIQTRWPVVLDWMTMSAAGR